MDVIGHNRGSAIEAEASTGSCLELLSYSQFIGYSTLFFSSTWFELDEILCCICIRAAVCNVITPDVSYSHNKSVRECFHLSHDIHTCSIGNFCCHQIRPVAFLLKFSPWCHEKATAQFYGSCRCVVGSLIQALVGSHIVPHLRQIYFELCFICHKSGMGITKSC